MSFEPVTMYKYRCDGITTRGQCTEVLRYPDEDGEGEFYDALTSKPEISEGTKSSAEWLGWLVFGERILCPKHVAGAEYLAEAGLVGLPFPDFQTGAQD